MKINLVYLIPFIVILFYNCKSHYKLSAISEDMYNLQKFKCNDNFLIKSSNTYRKEFKLFQALNYNSKKDTIFILELPGIQGDYNFTSWNSVDTISYTYRQGIFELTREPLFSKYMMKLVSNWDINEIRKEEIINSNFIPNEIVYAYKIIFSNKKYKIDCICFKDFFNIERDIMIINE